MAVGRPAVFVDKDGTLVRDVPYNSDPALVELVPGAGAALAALRASGYLVLVVSNQSGLARGLFTQQQLEAATERLVELLAGAGTTIDGFAWCPHHPDGTVAELAIDCDCRKPHPGMLLRAADEHDIDLAASWMVGDILNDIEAGARAGCRTVLVDVGSETEWLSGALRTPTATCGSLPEAAQVILDARGAA
ncbi:MAG: hydrolase, HAD-superfamily, subfamily [Thermoleophilia bacterium]|nr:hydrolase, HAD-superfamily, subfamily [Thermoleophilia bacterium]MCZ4495980.1 hydrolase, HAD-superfamily, subfamily [Thermoleophilia bacterium]